jgi:Flp pilus assembly protein TadG
MTTRRKKQRGGSALEMALMLPWYIFLFVGTYDWGYYAHGLISTESAARVAALYTSQSAGEASDQATACILANEELRIEPNVSGSGTPTCGASPVIVTATELTGSSTPDQAGTATKITVQYTTVGLIPIPGVLESSATFYRVVTLRTRS